MPQLRISRATEHDAPAILDLIRGLAEYEKLSHVVTATEARLRETLFGSNPSAEVILANWDDECAGFVVFFPTYSTFLAQPALYLEDLYVRPHLRGNGIGLALFQQVAKVAAERGCGRLEWGVLDWNLPAIEFYKRLGAVPVNGWTKYRLTVNALGSAAGLDH